MVSSLNLDQIVNDLDREGKESEVEKSWYMSRSTLKKKSNEDKKGLIYGQQLSASLSID